MQYLEGAMREGFTLKVTAAAGGVVSATLVRDEPNGTTVLGLGRALCLNVALTNLNELLFRVASCTGDT